jgi:dephospho-CoA kinase
MHRPALRLGLTGGIGSGKSTVAQILVQQGAHLVDTDAIAHALTAPGGRALPALRAAFGDAVFAGDGALDRAALRERVFADPDQRRRLEGVLHPLIGEEARLAAGLAGSAPMIVFDVPLLAESAHWRHRVDKVLVVDCSEATQVQRVAARPGWTPDAAERVIAVQAPRAQRRAVADAVIHNDGIGLDGRQGLRAQVLALWAHWAHGVRRVA